MEPTARQRRILANLKGNNLIWEVGGQRYFSQFDNRFDREIRIHARELEEMSALGWIRRVEFPKAEQRLDRYEPTENAPHFDGIGHRKPPARESQILGLARRRRRT